MSLTLRIRWGTSQDGLGAVYLSLQRTGDSGFAARLRFPHF